MSFTTYPLNNFIPPRVSFINTAKSFKSDTSLSRKKRKTTDQNSTLRPIYQFLELLVRKHKTNIDQWVLKKQVGKDRGDCESRPDDEQTSNNYESIGSPARSSFVRIPGRANNQIGTSAPRIPRNEPRNVNQQRARFTTRTPFAFSSTRRSISLFFPKSVRTYKHASVLRHGGSVASNATEKGDDATTFLSIQFDSDQFMWLVRSIGVITSTVNRRIGKVEDARQRRSFGTLVASVAT